MSIIDIQALLAAPPSGPTDPEKRRELDSAVFLLEQKVHALTQNAGADSQDKNTDLNTWKEIQTTSIELMGSAHDLRLAVLLTQALLLTEGLLGFNDGLMLIHELLENHWEALIPEEDKADQEDPFFERINLLENLCEWQGAIKPLMSTPICASRATGQFCLRDLRIATGKKVEMFVLTEAEKTSPPQMSAIQAACKSMEATELTARKDTTGNIKESLAGLGAELAQRVGAAKAPNFEPISDVIAEVDDFYAHQLSLRGLPGVLSVLKQSLGGKNKDQTHPSASEAPDPGPMGNSMDTINSRQDVIRLLDQICVFYNQNEPASPVPLLLKRARQLVEKNFYEIMEDLAPKTATELKKLIGEPGDDES